MRTIYSQIGKWPPSPVKASCGFPIHVFFCLLALSFHTHYKHHTRPSPWASEGVAAMAPWRPNSASAARAVRALALLSVLAAAAAALRRRRRKASREAQTKTVVGRGVRLLLAIDIGSSSVRCSAYTVGSPPLLVPGCAVRLKHAVVKKDGTADAEEVIDLVDTAVDRCFR